ncbi:hypothetical protein CDD83_10798 [Cordyceps sp. RAO-2017]|nr:hypothetical protein CDD83_10798 [Cordyceps sp. RAO-2017]
MTLAPCRMASSATWNVKSLVTSTRGRAPGASSLPTSSPTLSHDRSASCSGNLGAARSAKPYSLSRARVLAAEIAQADSLLSAGQKEGGLASVQLAHAVYHQLGEARRLNLPRAPGSLVARRHGSGRGQGPDGVSWRGSRSRGREAESGRAERRGRARRRKTIETSHPPHGMALDCNEPTSLSRGF